MAEKIVTIDIDPDGNFTLDMEGFHGKGCKDLAKQFEQMGPVLKSEDKASLHEGPGGEQYISAGK